MKMINVLNRIKCRLKTWSHRIPEYRFFAECIMEGALVSEVVSWVAKDMVSSITFHTASNITKRFMYMHVLLPTQFLYRGLVTWLYDLVKPVFSAVRDNGLLRSSMKFRMIFLNSSNPYSADNHGITDVIRSFVIR